ncbi:hypothetical protein BGY98DRAFT_1086767 [Russula aff. rugulosa BPL654]|nr:hypothetical protein BGY98DRAFT_1086767 [Russula aff. rugulosa BPL654]
MTATDAPKTLSFRALQLVNEQRSLYGLRYHDHERYRKHCANRTHRLRSSLKVTHGRGRDFKKPPVVPQDKIQDGHLQLLLYQAERAWSYAQELLSLAAFPTNESKASALRHNATGRFRRAVHWATQLLSQCQMAAYTLVLNGRFLRYRDEFEDALVQLSVARGILDELAESADTSRDQALATYFGDEIGPEIRSCKAYDVDGIVREQSAQHRAQIVDGYEALVQRLKNVSGAESKGNERKLQPLLWEGEPVPVRNPELVDVLVKVQEGEVKLREESIEEEAKAGQRGKSKRGVAAYDNILLALSDAEDVARKLAEAQKNASGSTSTSSVPGVRDIHFVHVFINSQASRRHAGSKTASSKSQKETVDARLYPAIVKLFDTILQSLNQMRTLSIVDESPDLAAAVDSRVSFTNARRCRYLALTYVPVKRFAEAVTLVQRSNIHLREARSVRSTVDTDPIVNGDPAFFPLASEDFDQFDKELAEEGNRLKSDWFAYNGGSLTADNKEYKKPLFFDIALNYVQLDVDHLQERAGKKPQPAVQVQAPAPVHAAEEVPVDKRPVAKAKVEEILRPATPEPTAPAQGGLGSLLGGWWGRR